MTTVRPARMDDLDALCEVLEDLPLGGPETIDRDAARRAMQQLLESPGRVLLVAEHEGAIVGTTDLIIVWNLTHNARSYANIENVMVRRESRGHGIGRSLVQHAVDHARAAGCYKVQLTTNVARSVAHELYESVGFEPLGIGYRLYF